jgi:hypothetical protein
LIAGLVLGGGGVRSGRGRIRLGLDLGRSGYRGGGIGILRRGIIAIAVEIEE